MQRKWVGSIFLILVLGMLGADRSALAHGRLGDKDLERLMQNVKDDAPPFRESFDNALKKSTIRKTSRERDARALADTFAKQANGALETFKHQHKAENAVAALVSTAGQIDALVYSLQLNAQTTARWEKLRAELHLSLIHIWQTPLPNRRMGRWKPSSISIRRRTRLPPW